MTTEITIEPAELQILLNLYPKRLQISYPPYGFTILTAKPVDTGYELSLDSSPEQFDDGKTPFTDLYEDMPSYSDLRTCMLASGIQDYTNVTEFYKNLKSYRHLKKQVTFCLDTNLYYYRFLSAHDRPLASPELLTIDTVKNEITAALNYKYTHNNIISLKQQTPYNKHLFEELYNGKTKKSRLAAYLAKQEYQSIAGKSIAIKGTEPSSSDTRHNDEIIVKTLRQKEKEQDMLPVLLTADDAMADLCDTETLEYFLFEAPHTLKVDQCSHRHMIKLLYTTAVIFGFIKLNSAIIFGEYRGKTVNRATELKLRLLDNEKANQFMKHLKLCRKLQTLNIPQ